MTVDGAQRRFREEEEEEVVKEEEEAERKTRGWPQDVPVLRQHFITFLPCWFNPGVGKLRPGSQMRPVKILNPAHRT